jgi:BlaI family penicillinase repressor
MANTGFSGRYGEASFVYLTKNELEIMDVLWEQKRPLSRGELLALPEKKTWMDSSIHILLNSLLRKGAIREAGYAKCGKTSGRIYEAALSCAEYYVTTLDSTRIQPGAAELMEAYLAVKPLDEASRQKILALLSETRE